MLFKTLNMRQMISERWITGKVSPAVSLTTLRKFPGMGAGVGLSRQRSVVFLSARDRGCCLRKLRQPEFTAMERREL